MPTSAAVEQHKKEREQHADGRKDDERIGRHHQIARDHRREVEHGGHRQHLAPPDAARNPAQHVAEADAHQRKADVRPGLDALDQPDFDQHPEQKEQRHRKHGRCEKRQAGEHHQDVDDEGARHDQIAMAEIDHRGGTVDHAHRQPHQRVDRALSEAAQGELQGEHLRSERFAPGLQDGRLALDEPGHRYVLDAIAV
jgi:hypothetical protein